MSFRRRALFLAGLFVAVSCSDAGNPMGPEGPEARPDAEDVLAVLTCTVDVRAGTETCKPDQPTADGALGDLVHIGNATQVALTKTNTVSTPTSLSYDRAVTNMIYQALGTADGVTPHAMGVRVWVEPPFFVDTTIAGQPTSVTVANPDGFLTYKTNKNKPYFQYPGLLQPGATSPEKNWQFTMQNVDSFSYKVLVLSELQYYLGTLWITPDSSVFSSGDSVTLAAHVRDATKLSLDPLTWTSSNPDVTVTEVPGVDSLAVVKSTTDGATAWIKAVSNHPNARWAAPRRDSVLVTVNNKPNVPVDTIQALSRVSVRLSGGRTRKGLAAGDNVVPNKVYETSNGIATINSLGALTYVSKGSFSGADEVMVDVTDGQWTVQRKVVVNVQPSRYWFVQQGAADGVRRGSNKYPLRSISAAADSAQAGDTIFVLRNGSAPLVEAAALEAGRALIGEGVVVALTRTALNEPSAVDTVFHGQGVGSPIESISGAATTAISVSGGSVAITLSGDVTHAGSGRLLQVSSHSGGASFAGALTATAGTGMLFNAAGGTYAFNGAVSLAGGDAGLDLGSSDGVFTFANASVSNPTGGPAVHVVGGTPALVYRGSITHNTGRAVLVDGITADSVVLRAAITSGTSAAPTGLGILVQNVSGGRVALDSAKSLFTGANPAVTLTANTGGLIRFGGGLDITTTTGAGFTASGSDTVTVTGTNSVATGTGIPVSLTGVRTGESGVSFASVTTSAGAANGIVLNGIAGAGFQATGGTISGTTGPAVLLTNTNAADSISLRSMTLGRSAGTGAVISGNTFGKLHVLGTSVTATGGPGALSLASGTLSGTYGTLSSNASTSNGVSLTGVNGSLNVSGGSINTAGAAAFAISGGDVGGTVSATVAQASAFPLLSVAGDHNGTITFAGNLTAINGNGLQFTAADGTYNLTGSLTLGGAGSAAGNDAGIDIASGSSGTVNVTPAGAGTANITSPAGIAIAIVGGSADLTYNGNVTQATNTSLLSVTGGHSGDVAFPNGTVNASNGNGLQFDNADGTYVFGGTVTLQGGDAGIDVTNGSGGTFTFPTTASIVSPSTGNLVSILNSAPTFTYSGQFTKANNNVTGIFVSGNTGGSITFNGTGTKSISSGTAAAVNLASNGTASILFSGGGLNLTSGAGNGFTATGGGTVQVTGATNTISSTGGIALNVQNTTIGASGMSFQSISASGGANGIVLNSTGTGVLTVAGNGGNCTVATPTCTGGLIASTTGAGVSLTSAQAVFNRLRVQGAQSHGITATGSTNLTLNSSYLQGNGNGDEENGLNLLNVAGTVLVDASSFNGAAENLIRVDNNNANLTLTVQNASSFEFPNPELSAFRNSAILITPKGSSAVTAVVTNSTFRNIPNYSFQFAPDASVTGIGNATFTNNTLSADAGLNVTCASNAQCRVGHIGVGGTGGTTNFVATGNNFNRVNGDGVFILGANQSSTLRMRIDNNTISNALDDAFVVGLGQNARVIAQFNGNTISNIGADVLEVASGEVNAGFGAGSASDMDLVFTNNSMNTVGTNSSLAATGGPGVFRFGDADQLLCLAFTGNSMSGPLPTTGLKVYLDGNFGGMGGSMTYEGTGAGALTDAKIQSDNPGMSLAPANTVISAVNLSNGATCQRPGI
jgi:hypothetical protein